MKVIAKVIFRRVDFLGIKDMLIIFVLIYKNSTINKGKTKVL